MKKNFNPLCMLLMVGSFGMVNFAQAQKSDSIALAGKKQEVMDVYHRAIQYNDLSSASYALTSYLNAGGDPTYLDTLAVVYYNMNNFSGAYKLANEQYTKDAKNVTALTLLADISGRSGETKTSLEWYEKLVVLNPAPYNYYQLASKQFVLERKLECRQSLEKVVADSAQASKEPVSLEVSNGYFEQVPVLAAAYNMLGVLAFNDKKNDEAKALYNKALAIAPKFVIAQQNLDGLKPANATKPASKTTPASKTKG
jgi:tetratricopeptide (TPR) repeat protein